MLSIANSKKKVVADFILYGIAFSFSPLMQIFVYPIITKSFSPSVYGNYSYLQVIFNILLSILVSWNVTVVSRYLNASNEHKDAYAKNIVLIIWVGSFIYAVAVVIISSFYQSFFIVIVAINLYLSSLAQIFFSYLKTNGQVKKYCILQILNVVCTYSVLFLLIKMGCQSIVIIFIGTMFFNLVMITIFATKKNEVIFSRNNVDSSLIKGIMRFGLPLIAVNLSGMILNAGDKIVINNLLTDGEKFQGIYSIHYSVYNNLAMIIVTIFTSLCPYYLLPLYDSGKYEEYKSALKKLITIYMLIVTIMNILVIVNYQNINYILFDNAYQVKENLGPVIFTGVIFFGLYQLTSNYFFAGQKSIYVSIFIIFSAILNLLLNVILIPKFGYSVAAFTTFFSYALNYIMAYFVVKRLFGVVVSLCGKLLVLINLCLLFISYFFQPFVYSEVKVEIMFYIAIQIIILLVILLIFYFISVAKFKKR